MRLVEPLVDERVVKAAVDPVDEEVGKGDEEGELGEAVLAARALVGGVVELGVAADFSEEDWDGEDGQDRHGPVGLFDFKPHLVLQELGVLHRPFVKDKRI